jgi:hypothetical protein
VSAEHDGRSAVARQRKTKAEKKAEFQQTIEANLEAEQTETGYRPFAFRENYRKNVEKSEAKRAAKQAEKQARLEETNPEKAAEKAAKAAATKKAEAEKAARVEAYKVAKAEAKARDGVALHRTLEFTGIGSGVAGLIQQHSSPDEAIEAAVIGTNGYALVAYADRMVLAKKGIGAGSFGGGRATTFVYRNVTGVQVNTGIVTGTIVIAAPGFNNSPGDFWASHSGTRASSNDNPHHLPNVLPITKGGLRKYAVDIARIQELVREAQQAPAPPAPAPAAVDIADQLAGLTRLHDTGALTDEEFAAAKKRLIAGD